jgi:hypothetical protein
MSEVSGAETHHRTNTYKNPSKRPSCRAFGRMKSSKPFIADTPHIGSGDAAYLLCMLCCLNIHHISPWGVDGHQTKPCVSIMLRPLSSQTQLVMIFSAINATDDAT